MKSKVVETSDGRIICRDCGKEVNQCCDCFGYLSDGDVVICYNDQHFCEECGGEYI